MRRRREVGVGEFERVQARLPGALAANVAIRMAMMPGVGSFRVRWRVIDGDMACRLA